MCSSDLTQGFLFTKQLVVLLPPMVGSVGYCYLQWWEVVAEGLDRHRMMPEAFSGDPHNPDQESHLFLALVVQRRRPPAVIQGLWNSRPHCYFGFGLLSRLPQ